MGLGRSTWGQVSVVACGAGLDCDAVLVVMRNANRQGGSTAVHGCIVHGIRWPGCDGHVDVMNDMNNMNNMNNNGHDAEWWWFTSATRRSFEEHHHDGRVETSHCHLVTYARNRARTCYGRINKQPINPIPVSHFHACLERHSSISLYSISSSNQIPSVAPDPGSVNTRSIR